MTTKKLHYISGLTITIFTALHLANHVWSLAGAEKHIQLMNALRLIYRTPLVEAILLLAVAVQIISGLKLFRASRKTAVGFFDKLQIWTGLYLAVFFLIHVGAVLGGRLVLHLDTNFYFGVAGLNTFPFNLFFVPYYTLAILSFFGHLASVHNKKTRQSVFGLSPSGQSMAVLIFGVLVTLAAFYGLTNGFQGIKLPKEYEVLIGR